MHVHSSIESIEKKTKKKQEQHFYLVIIGLSENNRFQWELPVKLRKRVCVCDSSMSLNDNET